jgi:hypothetical protein
MFADKHPFIFFHSDNDTHPAEFAYIHVHANVHIHIYKNLYFNDNAIVHADFYKYIKPQREPESDMDADVQRYSDIHMDQNIHSDADGHGYGIVKYSDLHAEHNHDIYTHAVRHGKPHIYGNRDIYAHLHADMHVKLDAYTDTHVDPVGY